MMLKIDQWNVLAVNKLKHWEVKEANPRKRLTSGAEIDIKMFILEAGTMEKKKEHFTSFDDLEDFLRYQNATMLKRYMAKLESVFEISNMGSGLMLSFKKG